MYSEVTTIINVKQTGENEYQLDMTAGELYVRSGSGDVIRRHAVSAVENKYVALSAMKLDGGTYTFTFESGDAFTATSPDAYPAASSVSDNIGGGGSGGMLKVTATVNAQELLELDKTYNEIHDAMENGGAYVAFHEGSDDENFEDHYNWIMSAGFDDNKYFVQCADTTTYYSDSADGVLVEDVLTDENAPVV